MPSIINASTSTGLVTTADTSGVLQLQTGGTAAVTVDASANVGIGTASPAQKLNVSGSGSVYGLITNTGTGPSNLFLGAGNGQTQVISRDATTGAVPTVFLQGTTESMRIDSSGNVGIGITSPLRKLVVSNAGAQGFEFGAGTGGGSGNELLNYNRSTGLYVGSYNYASLYNFYAGTAGSTLAISVDTSGNVSIPKGVGGTPAFSIYASGTTSVPTSTYTKVLFNVTEFDTTGGMVASSRFTPTVAGYYYITGSAYYSDSSESFVQINKNGTELKRGTDHGSLIYSRMVNALVYLNGSTDYVEIYTYQASGSTKTVSPSGSQTFFQGFLARAA